MTKFFIFTRTGKDVHVTEVEIDINDTSVANLPPAATLQQAINALTAQGHVYLDTIKVS